MKVSGWGRYPSTLSTIHIVNDQRSKILSDLTDHCIAQGMQRSYGDSALAPHILRMTALDECLHFDIEKGMVRCLGGISLKQILEIIIPQGWFLPVTPGTQYVTLAGAIASDVHGKNHHKEGCFSCFVTSMDMMMFDGRIITCSREQHASLFHASCGGMGLTGIILQATLRLKPIKSTYIKQNNSPTKNLKDTLHQLDATQHSTYQVAWIDGLTQQKHLGRGIVMLGEHHDMDHSKACSSRSYSLPFNLPDGCLSTWNIKCFNQIYHALNKREKKQIVHYQSFFYPLDHIQHWNRMYGKRGFLQYQCVLPKEGAYEGLFYILKHLNSKNKGSFLAVLKSMGASNNNNLSFPMKGYTLALDLQIKDDLFSILEHLDACVLDHGGRLYLAKDARMNEATFKASYPNHGAFQEVRAQYGAIGTFASLQSIRLGLDTARKKESS